MSTKRPLRKDLIERHARQRYKDDERLVEAFQYGAMWADLNKETAEDFRAEGEAIHQAYRSYIDALRAIEAIRKLKADLMSYTPTTSRTSIKIIEPTEP